MSKRMFQSITRTLNPVIGCLYAGLNVIEKSGLERLWKV